jgi:hypothetical protein
MSFSFIFNLYLLFYSSLKFYTFFTVPVSKFFQIRPPNRSIAVFLEGKYRTVTEIKALRCKTVSGDLCMYIVAKLLTFVA